MSKKQIIQSLRGMRDILPDDQLIWEKIRQITRDTAETYNFFRIDTPILESANLFERPLGEGSEVVEKQMFVVKTRGGERLVLRPEGTAGVARAYIQNGLSHLSQPLKLYYEGPMFRYERPQGGRLRQFNHVGFEIISNEDDAIYDAQVILVCFRLISALKIKDLTIHINSIGCKVCRAAYRRKLLEYFKNKSKFLCSDCRRRLKINPLRILDCKDETCRNLFKEVPIMVDNLCYYCKKHFKLVLEYLDELNLPYILDHYLVRGFDYYNRTVFEIFTEGFDSALAGGGRYDYLIKMLGGRLAPGVGGALGIERVVEIIKNRNLNIGLRKKPKVFLVNIGELAKKKALSIIEILQKQGIEIMELLGKKSLTAQLRSANKLKSPITLILGQQEVFEESIIIRDMNTGTQESVPLKKVVKIIKKKLK